MGPPHGIYLWDSASVRGVLMGTCFGRLWIVFLSGGVWGKKKTPGHVQQGRFLLGDSRFQTVPDPFFCVVAVIYVVY